jgi:hypothetical protein
MANSTEVITYSLRGDQKCGCPFYRDVPGFTDETAAQGEELLGPLVDAYLAFLIDTARETPRTRLEYLFELLTLGVLWRMYGQAALALPGFLAGFLSWLSALREQNQQLKKAADRTRGLFAVRLRSARTIPPANPPFSSTVHLQRLLRWMQAAGRFNQEIRRLRGWQEFFTRRSSEMASPELSAVAAFAGWFETRSLETLGAYTPHVEQFLAETQPGYRWREDYVLCGRQRVEYHLNMVGNEIFNRALRDDFRRTTKQVVLVPPCLRAQPDDLCKAVSTPLGARCIACTPTCRVHQLSKLGEQHGFEVFTLPDDLRVYSGGSFKQNSAGPVGMIGVSCVLTNIQGGWDVRDLGIPAQGLLLDYCGCSYHWHEKGIPTDIDIHQLMQLLGIPEQPEDEI